MKVPTSSSLFLAIISVLLVFTDKCATLQLGVELRWIEHDNTTTSTSLGSLSGDPYRWIDQSPLPLHHPLLSPSDSSGSDGAYVVIDPSTNIVFWNDKESQQIVATGNQRSVPIYTGTSAAVTGLTIDWLSKNMYWTDATYNWVMMATMRHSPAYYRILHDTDVDQPSGIVADPYSRYIFWCDIGSVPKLERSSLAGEDRKSIVVHDIWRPSAIALDFDNNAVYWTESEIGTLNMVNYDGSGRLSLQMTLNNGGLVYSAFDFAINKDFIFVSEEKQNAIRVFKKNTFDHIGDILSKPRGLYVTYKKDIETSACDNVQCEHICVNVNSSSAKCYCSLGYQLKDDGVSCSVSTVHHQPQVVYAKKSSICTLFQGIAEELTKKELCFFSSNKDITGLTYNAHSDTVYFVQDNHILRLRLSTGEKPHVLLSEQQGDITGLAVDWVNSHLYWTNREQGVIRVSNLDGLYQRTVVKNCEKPRAIMVDPSRNTMYWVTQGRLPTIERSDLDGQHRAVVVDNLVQPSSMVMDAATNTIYWSDESNGRVEMINLDTKQRSIVVDSNGLRILGVTLHKDYLIWTTATQMHFSIKYLLRKPARNPMDITDGPLHDVISYDATTQPLIPSVCSHGNNGGCDHMCFPSVTGAICQCAFGYIKNGSSCHTEPLSEEFILATDYLKHSLYQVNLQKVDDVRAVPISSLDNAVALAYDSSRNIVFWTDVQAKTIKRAHIDGSHETVIAVLDDKSIPSGLAVDVDKEKLFFTDMGHHTVNSMNLMGGERRVVAKNILSPRAITICTKTRLVYFATQGLKPTIYRMTYMGSHLKAIVRNAVIQPNGLTVDYDGHRLYWTDGAQGKIESIMLDGTERKVVYHKDGAQFFDVFLQDNWLYFGDWSNGAIYKLHKTGVTLQAVSEGTFARPHDIIVSSNKLNSRPKVKDLDDSQPDSHHIIIISSMLTVGFVGILIAVFLMCKWSRRVRRCLGKEEKQKWYKKEKTRHRRDDETATTVCSTVRTVRSGGSVYDNPKTETLSNMSEHSWTRSGKGKPNTKKFSPDGVSRLTELSVRAHNLSNMKSGEEAAYFNDRTNLHQGFLLDGQQRHISNRSSQIRSSSAYVMSVIDVGH